MLRRKGFIINKSRNMSMFSTRDIASCTNKDFKWVLKNTEFIMRDKKAISIRSSSVKDGNKGTLTGNVI